MRLVLRARRFIWLEKYFTRRLVVLDVCKNERFVRGFLRGEITTEKGTNFLTPKKRIITELFKLPLKHDKHPPHSSPLLSLLRRSRCTSPRFRTRVPRPISRIPYPVPTPTSQTTKSRRHLILDRDLSPSRQLGHGVRNAS